MAEEKLQPELQPEPVEPNKQEELDRLEDLYKRTVAEMQNSNRRHAEELNKVQDYAISNFAQDCLVVKDYLEMALADKSGNLEALKQGVELTLRQLNQVLENYQVLEIEAKPGDKLDPHLHQAVDKVDSVDYKPGTLTEILRKGYRLKSRILRPAMIKAVKEE